MTRVEMFSSDGRLRGDAYFVYNAFASLPPDDVLIKVGISTKPLERLVSIHSNSPFGVELACLTPVGRKRLAQSVEAKILDRYGKFRTRGEWLRVPADPEFRKDFAGNVRAIVSAHTGRPVEWKRVDAEQIKLMMDRSFRKMAA